LELVSRHEKTNDRLMVLLEHEKLQQGLSSLIGQAQEMADDLSGVKDFSLAAEAQEMAVRCFGGEVDVATTPLTGIVAARDSPS